MMLSPHLLVLLLESNEVHLAVLWKRKKFTCIDSPMSMGIAHLNRSCQFFQIMQNTTLVADDGKDPCSMQQDD